MRHLSLSLVLLLVCLLTTPTWAARGFGATEGTGASDVIATTHATGQTQMSWCIWAYRTGAGGGNSGRMWDQLGTNLLHASAATTYQFTADWDTTNGAWTVVAPSATTWHLICVTYDGALTTNNPLIYVDGSSVTVTETQTPVGSFVTNVSNTLIGNEAGGIRNWNGRLAELAIWEGTLLSAGNISSLWNGGVGTRMDSLATKPTAYWRMCGTTSPEPNAIAGGISGAVTGATFDTHPFTGCRKHGRALMGVGD